MPKQDGNPFVPRAPGDRQHKLPDGTLTNDFTHYLHQWEEVVRPLKDLGFVVIGFDPGISFYDRATGTGSFELPVYAARRIAAELVAARRWRFVEANPWRAIDILHLKCSVEPVDWSEEARAAIDKAIEGS